MMQNLVKQMLWSYIPAEFKTRLANGLFQGARLMRINGRIRLLGQASMILAVLALFGMMNTFPAMYSATPEMSSVYSGYFVFNALVFAVALTCFFIAEFWLNPLSSSNSAKIIEYALGQKPMHKKVVPSQAIASQEFLQLKKQVRNLEHKNHKLESICQLLVEVIKEQEQERAALKLPPQKTG